MDNYGDDAGTGLAWVSKSVVVEAPKGSGGEPAAPPPFDGDSASIHFRGRVPGTTGEPLVDTRTLLQRPFDLRVGKAFVVPEMEVAIKSMAPGERSSFRFSPAAMPGFSQLVTVLRRQHREATSTDGCHVHEHTGGCCAAHMYGDDETKDLREAMGSEVEVEIELVSVQRSGSYERSSWELTWAEKIQAVLDYKHAGNAAVGRKDYTAAAVQYEHAIGLVESVRLASKSKEIEDVGADASRALDEHLPLLLNYSLCMIKLKKYGDAVDHASVVLGVQPDNVKALYRRGQAHFERGRDIDSALADLEKAHSLQPENDAVRKLLLQCRREVAAKTKQDRVKYAGMFDN